jgi:flavin reductase (DIM6/NTAB) family NADH-FMN oxidoreductase RutF
MEVRRRVDRDKARHRLALVDPDADPQASVLADSLATFECSPWATYEGGDHLNYVGMVERLTIGDVEGAALGYFRGRYFTSPD